ncbi:MAG: hypothetical protein LKH70_03630 [Prevotella sp.]|jgi:hypothetical protein|nr:hypothetical protein [Prevotella sp.]MCI1548873.1 hypothetical protein [Prevotella sp.]
MMTKMMKSIFEELDAEELSKVKAGKASVENSIQELSEGNYGYALKYCSDNDSTGVKKLRQNTPPSKCF